MYTENELEESHAFLLVSYLAPTQPLALGCHSNFLSSVLSFFSLCNKYTICLLKRKGEKGWSKIGRQQKFSCYIPFTNPYNKIFSRLIDLPAIFKPTDVSYRFPDALRSISHLRNKWRATNLDKEGSLFPLGIFEFNQLYLPFK
jgi:hypothetical protein